MTPQRRAALITGASAGIGAVSPVISQPGTTTCCSSRGAPNASRSRPPNYVKRAECGVKSSALI